MQSTIAEQAIASKPRNTRILKPGAGFRQFCHGIAGLLVLVVLWDLGTRLLQSSIPLASMLGPRETFASLYELIITNQLTTHTVVSLKRVLVGLGLALVIGVPFGLAIGSSRVLESSTGGAFQFLRMISPLSWMPIAVMVFGIGDAPIYFLLTFAAVWPIMLNTAAGVRSLDPKWLMLAKSLSATPAEVLLRIVVPGILGHVLTGVRLAIGIIWIVLVRNAGGQLRPGVFHSGHTGSAGILRADGGNCADRGARLHSRRPRAKAVPVLVEVAVPALRQRAAFMATGFRLCRRLLRW
jgi:NitT/TauT family transport system permease protein